MSPRYSAKNIRDSCTASSQSNRRFSSNLKSVDTACAGEGTPHAVYEHACGPEQDLRCPLLLEAGWTITVVDVPVEIHGLAGTMVSKVWTNIDYCLPSFTSILQVSIRQGAVFVEEQ